MAQVTEVAVQILCPLPFECFSRLGRKAWSGMNLIQRFFDPVNARRAPCFILSLELLAVIIILRI